MKTSTWKIEMNEQAKSKLHKLADQCKHPDNYHQGPWMDYIQFAELIVKECAGIYSKIDNGNLHMGTDNYLEALQKHFGVEE
jgi:hypothetical protein